MDHTGGRSMHHAAAPAGTAKADDESRHQRRDADDAVDDDDDEVSSAALFGDLPEAKRRKFILVDDTQRGTRVRVRVMLDQVRMAEMPDSYRKSNSVFPRSWFATEMQDAGAARARWPDDLGDEEGGAREDDGERVRTVVPVKLMDDSEVPMGVPRMTRSRRRKEMNLNDLGYRMSWSQSRVFSGRTLFLQRSRKFLCAKPHSPR